MVEDQPLDWEIDIAMHNNYSVIHLRFEYEQYKINWIRNNLRAIKWNGYAKCWQVADNEWNRKQLGLPPRTVGSRMLNQIHPINRGELLQFVERLQLKAYSKSTIRTYTAELAQWLYAIEDASAKLISTEEVRAYLLYCINQLNLSENQMHSRMNALKFYMVQVLNRENFLWISHVLKRQNRFRKYWQNRRLRNCFR